MALRMPPPKMSLRVLFESLGHPEYFKFFREAGLTMVDANSHWSDVDVDDIIMAVEKRRSDQKEFTTDERVFLWKCLRFMWSRGPNHNCKFLQPSEVQSMFLPKRDWRQMDSDVKFSQLDPDRQRQILRKPQLMRGGQGFKEVQFEVYRRQQDIFYEVKDIENSIAAWMRSDPRKMMREDPREEAMKLRIRTIMDAVGQLLHVRKAQRASRYRWNVFFLLCRLVLIACSGVMYVTGYVRYSHAPTMGLIIKFWTSSGQFVSGTAFMLAFWFAFLVADRTKEDRQHKRFNRVLLNLERLSEDISSFRVESYDYRMEEHEAAAQMVSAQITHDQVRAEKTEMTSKPKRRRKKKQVDKDLAGWAPDVKLDNMDEWRLQLQKDIENSYRKLDPLPNEFRQNGGDRMEKMKFSNALQHRSLRSIAHEDRFMGYRTQIEDFDRIPEHHATFDADLHHVKAPMQSARREPPPRCIPVEPLPHRPSLRPPPDRPSYPPPASLPPLPNESRTSSMLGSTPTPNTPPFPNESRTSSMLSRTPPPFPTGSRTSSMLSRTPPYSRSTTALSDHTPLWVHHAQQHNISIASTPDPMTPQSQMSRGPTSLSLLQQDTPPMSPPPLNDLRSTAATQLYHPEGVRIDVDDDRHLREISRPTSSDIATELPHSLRETGGATSPEMPFQPYTRVDTDELREIGESNSIRMTPPEQPHTQLDFDDLRETGGSTSPDTDGLREIGETSMHMAPPEQPHTHLDVDRLREIGASSSPDTDGLREMDVSIRMQQSQTQLDFDDLREIGGATSSEIPSQPHTPQPRTQLDVDGLRESGGATSPEMPFQPDTRVNTDGLREIGETSTEMAPPEQPHTQSDFDGLRETGRETSTQMAPPEQPHSQPDIDGSSLDPSSTPLPEPLELPVPGTLEELPLPGPPSEPPPPE